MASVSRRNPTMVMQMGPRCARCKEGSEPQCFPSMLITGRYMRTQALNRRLMTSAGNSDAGTVATVKRNACLQPRTVCSTWVCSAHQGLLFQAYPLSCYRREGELSRGHAMPSIPGVGTELYAYMYNSEPQFHSSCVCNFIPSNRRYRLYTT